MKKPKVEEKNFQHGKKLTISFMRMILSMPPKYRDEIIKYRYNIK